MFNSKTVSEFVPDEAHSEFEELLDKHGNKKVLKTYYGFNFHFPNANFRNVHIWALLEDGSVIGMNESPRDGWSFPRVGKRAMINYYSKFRAEKPPEIDELLKS